MRGWLDDSYSELVEFLRVHPTHINGLNDCGCHLLDRGEISAAIDSFAKAVDNDPDAMSPRFNLIRSLCDAGWHQDATEHLETLARAGFDVRVNVEDRSVSIDINGTAFYRGEVKT